MNNMNRSRIIVGIGFVLTIMAIVFVVIFKTSYSYSSDANYLGEYDSIASDDDGEIEVMESDIANGDEESGEVEEEEEVNISTDGWDLTKVHIEYDSKGVPVPVPFGYVASGDEDENTVKTGFVIYEGEEPVTNENSWDESTKRNQWVWVPVPDPERIYSEDSSGNKIGKFYSFSSTGRKLSTSTFEPIIATNFDKESYFAQYNLIGMSREKFYEEMQNEFNATVESIKKYGGFYIGRYETGIFLGIPVVKRMNTNLTYQTWYNMYSKMKYLGANSNIIKANMIWLCLWDETLQWLVDSGNKSYSDIATHDGSKKWGNYRDSTFSYKNTSGTESTKSSGSSKEIPAGSAEYTKANNIYDLAGNTYEWTLGSFGSSTREYYGGNYNDTNHYASYLTEVNPSYSDSKIGFRAYLYIK